jgi:hypothetical protein
MSDGITEARRGTYFKSEKYKTIIENEPIMKEKKTAPKMNVGQEPHKEINFEKLPDPTNHQLISFLKSAVRISGYLLLFYSPLIAVPVLVFSEIIGIVEELV